MDEPEINYLAKDYASFRRLMLDRLAALLPDGVADQPADLQVAIIEALAYLADHLSYFQDAVATEAYLGTARSRISLRRHARLLDYIVHEGCNARVWVCCSVSRPTTVGEDWRFMTAGAAPVVFEPCRPDQELHPQLNRISVVPIVVPIGVGLPEHKRVKAKLTLPDAGSMLKRGDFLLLEATDDRGSSTLRHVVRLTHVEKPEDNQVLVEWGDEDNLPFDMPAKGGVAHGNIVLADHGASDRRSLALTANPDNGHSTLAARRSMPRVPAGPLTRAEPLPADLTAPPERGALTSAAALMRRDPRRALPQITLSGDGDNWLPVADLLGGGVSPTFVVEREHDGSEYLRFGDGRYYGKRPSSASLKARYRVGNGAAGNVAAEAIQRVEGAPAGVTVTVRNPLPACGGEDPESPEQVRLFAPQAYRRQERAVTPADYQAKAEEVQGVQRASAEIRSTGSWHTVYVYVDPDEGCTLKELKAKVIEELKPKVIEHLDPYRLAGFDLEIRGATCVRVWLELSIEVKPGFTPNAVTEALKTALGSKGFFSPDNWTFGQPVYLSRIYQAALAVPGVAVVRVQAFGRGQDDPVARERGVLPIGSHEIAQLDKDNPVIRST